MDPLRPYRTATRQRRMAFGWSQTETAARARIAPNALNQWESGRRMLSLDNFFSLFDALGLQVQIVEGEAPPAPERPAPEPPPSLEARVAELERAVTELRAGRGGQVDRGA